MYPLRNLPQYDPDALESTGLTYTTVYLGNYVTGDYSEGGGSHPGVDIVPKVKNDTVYSALSGQVVTAKENASEGKFVIIRHDNVSDAFGKVGTYFSCYLHLNEYAVSEGQTVEEGDEIGKTGSTGQSTGEHLHFQIDTGDAPFHPYWPFTFAEAQQLGLGFFEAVNRGLGIEKARKYTVNPLVFLARAKQNGGATPISKPATTVTQPTNVQASTTVAEKKIAASVTPASKPAVAAVFSDVSPNHPYYQAITYVKSKNIVQGQNGKFSPDAPITRAEILKMGFVASGKKLSSDTKSYFPDVPARHPLITYINTARETNIVGGYPNGYFYPNNAVTRAEGLKMLLRMFGTALEKVDGPVYVDVGLKDWCAPYVLWSRNNEVLQPKGLNFGPNTPLTRAEVANILYTLRA